MDNRQLNQLKFVAFADSTAHGYGSGDVFPLVEKPGCVATTSGGSLLLGNQDKKPSIAQVVINNWTKVATMVGKEPAQFLMTKVKVGIIPGRDSTAGDQRYDKLSNCRGHFGIPEGEKTINSYNAWCLETYAHNLYGTSGGHRMHFIGGKERAKEIFCPIMKCEAQTKQAATEAAKAKAKAAARAAAKAQDAEKSDKTRKRKRTPEQEDDEDDEEVEDNEEDEEEDEEETLVGSQCKPGRLQKRLT